MIGEATGIRGDHRDARCKGEKREAGFVFDPRGHDQGGAAA